jgi:hypothetical protein
MMEQVLPLGTVAGLRLSAKPSAALGSLIILALAFGVVLWLLGASVGEALLFGVLAVMVHWLSDIAHQLGHSLAARRTAHPMVGIRLWFIFSTALYPDDEPPLPAAIHIRRALGGPPMSLGVSLIALILALLLRPLGGVIWWLAVFCLLDNLLIFGLGAFLPLGFTDGSTLLHWWPRR